MRIPVQVTFRGMDHSPVLEQTIREKAAKLEQVYPNIMSCRVAIEEEGQHHRQGRQFNVRIDLHVPGHTFAVTHDHHEDAYVAVRDAFVAAKRRVQEELRLQRGEVKTHATAPHARTEESDD